MDIEKATKENGLTFVVCSTLISRGKSLTPESRMEMLLLSRWLLERSEDTQSANGFAIAVNPSQFHYVYHHMVLYMTIL